MKPSLQQVWKSGREHAGSPPPPRTAWQRFLVPVDFTEGSRQALKLAVSLAADPEDRITLLHVIAPHSLLHRGNAVLLTLSRTAAEVQAAAGMRLRRWAMREAGPDVQIATVVRAGVVHREILSVAETHLCDVIILAARPKPWYRRLSFLGSVSGRLARTAPCAVIAIRQPGQWRSVPVSFQPEHTWRATSSLRSPASNASTCTNPL